MNWRLFRDYFGLDPVNAQFLALLYESGQPQPNLAGGACVPEIREAMVAGAVFSPSRCLFALSPAGRAECAQAIRISKPHIAPFAGVQQRRAA